ncbi:MAG: glycosyl hydrolase [Methanosphaera sp. rholeuAM74]|nr:MAG: glycosyl hydrolase [Methanosphaera sp. rholeuAM74]
MTEIALLVPAYNEEIAIASMIILASKYVDEVIVIDDGSTDRTPEISQQVGATVLKHKTNKGKGAALKTGFDYAKDFDVIVTMDADGQHNPDEIPIVVKPILDGVADIVNGSRYLDGADTSTPTYRRVGQTILDSATNMASGTKLTDSQSGFRAFSKLSLSYFTFSPDGFGIESDMLIEASNNNLRIVEVGISVRYDVQTTRDNPVVQGFSVLMSILEVMRFNRPLYFYGIGGSIILFLGILMLLTLFFSKLTGNIYLLAIALFVIIFAIILIVIGIFMDTKAKFKK